MTKFTSRYVELGFYVDGSYRQFRNGTYVTEDAAEIAVLDGLTSDVTRVDEPKVEKKAEESAPVAPVPQKGGKASGK
jgi:hypothetical protein